MSFGQSDGSTFDLRSLGKAEKQRDAVMRALISLLCAIGLAAIGSSLYLGLTAPGPLGLLWVVIGFGTFISAISLFTLLTRFWTYPTAIAVSASGYVVTFENTSSWRRRWSEPGFELTVWDLRQMTAEKPSAPLVMVRPMRQRVPISEAAFQALVDQSSAQGITVQTARLTQAPGYLILGHKFLPNPK